MSDSVRPRLLQCAAICMLTFLCGCVSVPRGQQIPAITSAELSQHVEYLAQPALGGRKPKSWGSHLARRYLCKRFKALGLIPWGQTRSFAQSFSLGTNVIGVLPGSDPNLAQEIVILSAHYDHLGETPKGRCLGACDNASGVAVLLEIAEHFASVENRPRRSICFAAFDCEEMGLLGAFSFSCREDFVPSQITAVVNMDMLGRAGFDVLDKDLFLAGTASYPDLRRQIKGTASDHIQVLPIGTDVIGPRGDHVPFEFMGVPVLFFSGGPYPDYHQPSDTADKLDFSLIEASAEVIQQTVQLLANADCRYAPNQPDNPDPEELQGLATVISRIVKNPGIAELMSKKADLLDMIQAKITQYLAEPDAYTFEKRKVLAYWISEIALHYEIKTLELQELLPILLMRSMRSQRVFDMEKREALVDAGRKAVQHPNTHRPGLLRGMPSFSLNTSVLPDDHLVLTDLGNGRYQVVYCLLKARMRLQWSNLGERLQKSLAKLRSRLARSLLDKPRVSTRASLSRPVMTAVSHHWKDITGTPGEIADVILLGSRPERQRADTVYVFENYGGQGFIRAELNNKADEWTEAHSRILGRVTGSPEPKTREEWMQWRYRQGGWTTEQDWICDRLKSIHPDVVCEATLAVPVKQRQAIWCKVLGNRQQSPRLRSQALRRLHRKDPIVLQTLVDILDDQTPSQPWDQPLPDNHPLKAFATFCRDADGIEFNKKQDQKANPPPCLGDVALRHLKRLTKQDFDKDKASWATWIDAQGPAK